MFTEHQLHDRHCPALWGWQAGWWDRESRQMDTSREPWETLRGDVTPLKARSHAHPHLRARGHAQLPCHPQFGSGPSLSRVWLFATPWTAARQNFLSITNSQSLPKLMSIESVMPSNHLILCHPLLLLPSIFPSIRVFSNESVLYIKWPKYWSFSFSISSSNEYSGLISLRMDLLDLLAVQGTLKSLLQTIIQKHQFFDPQLSL